MKKLAAVALGCVLLAGCAPTVAGVPGTVQRTTVTVTPPQLGPSPSQLTPANFWDEARADLKKVTVRSATNQGSYVRDKFGKAWDDNNTTEFGRNGCDTRNDILKRDLTSTKFKAGTNSCVVLSGRLDDPYTNAPIMFVRGPQSAKVQIDHVVPLAYAWRQGAYAWSAEKRVNFANDPANLKAVDGPTNQAKSDSGPADWLPPNTGYRCPYVAAFVKVTVTYELSMDRADYNAADRILDAC